MNIKFEKDGVVKETHKKFRDDLVAIGWKVVEDKPKPAVKSSKKSAVKESLPEGN